MNYTQAADYLNGFVNLERGPLDRAARAAISLDGVRELAGRLGDPHKKFASIHVAGTKGKGSTCAFAASMLRAQGLRVGLYVSPHLEDVRERITIDGEKISEADFARLLTACAPDLEAMRNPPVGQRRPTYFEIVTHLAFAWFAEQRVDAAVLEVGLGGRLDATNIVAPEVCGIANISYDHTAILGDTLAKIAAEKAGILKRGVPAVTARQVPEAARTIKECADAAGAPLETISKEIAYGELDADSEEEWPLPRAWARLPEGTEYRATLGLRGGHQIENWALALRLADIFCRKQHRAPLTQDAVARGSREVVWPGRLEQVFLDRDRVGTNCGPAIYLDGAHNALSVKLALHEMRLHLKRSPLVCLFGCARDKDVRGMLGAMLWRGVGADEIVFTDSGNPRGCRPEELAPVWCDMSGRDGMIQGVERRGA